MRVVARMMNRPFGGVYVLLDAWPSAQRWRLRRVHQERALKWALLQA